MTQADKEFSQVGISYQDKDGDGTPDVFSATKASE